ncbi:DUF6979 family protein [Paenibacillus barengoltzii]|uniref:DUF6979 family protein n=1 Tax=Paenibacillus barengoltzii TaxID=343517 RepID=UPI002FD9CE9F
MGKYGEAAVRSVVLLNTGITHDPVLAWGTITREIFGEGTSSQKKGCPKGTFLGICESGLVNGVPAGTYTRSKLNKEYGLRALTLLSLNPELINDMKTLWFQTLGDNQKKHNQQMDVVISLWKNDLINTRNL